MQILPLLALSSAALLAQKPVAVEASVKKVDLADRSSPPVIQPISEQITLAQTAPAGLTAPKDCADAWFGTQVVGGRKLALAIGKSKADAELPDVLCVDLDGDGKFGDAERKTISVTKQAPRGQGGQAMQIGRPVDVEIGAGKLAASVAFRQVGENAPSASISFPSYLEAKTKVGNEERVIAVVDKDLDGAFGSAGDLWVLAKAGDRPATAFALSAMNERRFTDGQLVGIIVDKKTIQVASEAAKGPDPKDAAAHRRRVEHIWFERFDKDKEAFHKARGIDTTRPLAKQPIQWNYVSFDEALALSKKAGKPAFIDVMAFWCVWCYRLDHSTYPDQEVADLLNGSFVPVKIIQEQDLAGDYDKMMKERLEAQGIPAMGVFDADGRLLHKIGGWKKPEDFVKELKTALEKKPAAGDGK
jgi:thiol-disulfide isomerase/thioredoxin